MSVFAGRRHERRTALLFVSPWLVGFLALSLAPMLASLYYSFTRFNIFESPEWVGLDNYREMADDDRFWQSVVNTAYLTFVGVPLGLALALGCALVLNLRVRGQPVYRAIVYLPSIVPAVAATYLWRWLLNGDDGWVNRALVGLGLPAPNWLLDPSWTRPAIVLIGLWTIGGTMVIYLAALQDVPRQYHEAALLDGAGPLARFRHITLPTIAPVTLFQLVAGVILGLQNFTVPYLLTQNRLNLPSGGPDDTMLTYAVYLFQKAFSYLEMGYASAMAWTLFVITLALTVVILRIARRWIDDVGV